jgi:hypothetical protein
MCLEWTDLHVSYICIARIDANVNVDVDLSVGDFQCIAAYWLICLNC